MRGGGRGSIDVEREGSAVRPSWRAEGVRGNVRCGKMTRLEGDEADVGGLAVRQGGLDGQDRPDKLPAGGRTRCGRGAHCEAPAGRRGGERGAVRGGARAAPLTRLKGASKSAESPLARSAILLLSTAALRASARSEERACAEGAGRGERSGVISGAGARAAAGARGSGAGSASPFHPGIPITFPRLDLRPGRRHGVADGAQGLSELVQGVRKLCGKGKGGRGPVSRVARQRPSSAAAASRSRPGGQMGRKEGCRAGQKPWGRALLWRRMRRADCAERSARITSNLLK